jgi:hypothetical protein
MAARFCTACGNRLGEGDAFCSNCGRPVYETAQVDTSQANVHVPPPPHQQQPAYQHQAVAYPQPTGGVNSRTGRVRAGYYWLVFIILAVLALIAGDNGTFTALIGVIIAAVWVSRDAKSRGMENPETWAAGVFLLFIVFFPLYFFKRRPRM